MEMRLSCETSVVGWTFPRLAMSPQRPWRLGHWVGNVKEAQFERLHLFQILDQPIKFGYYKH